jgi:hypothetical protein
MSDTATTATAIPTELETHPGDDVAMSTRKPISDLSIGDMVELLGFEGPRTILGARRLKVGKNMTSKFDLKLADEAGEIETARFDMSEEVTIVGHKTVNQKQPEPGIAKKGWKAAKANVGDGKAKKERKPKAEKKPDGKMSAVEAAHHVLVAARKGMTCQELIAAMTEKGLWTSPGGLTPHATLYSAILRELKATGGESRFRKVEKGKFAAKTA